MFFLSALLSSLAAISIFTVLLVPPGYLLAWAADFFAFRRRTPAFRLAFSIPLSVAVLPLFLYFTGRFVSLDVAEAALALAALAFLAMIVRRGLAVPRFPRVAWIALAAWLCLSVLLSVDLPLGAKSYLPVTAADYAVRTEFIHSIGVTGVPPANPFFYPGHSQPLRYHYFWLILPGLVYRATAFRLPPQTVWIAAEFWAGLAFLCITVVTLRVFWTRGQPPFPARTVCALSLICITGLDIIPAAFLWFLRSTGMVAAVLPSLEWWNDQVDGFVYTAVWEAHYLAGLVACLVALVLLHAAAAEPNWRRRAVHAAIAGFIVAGAFGMAIYVAFVFGVFLAAWFVACLAKGWRAQAASLAIAGPTAVVFAIPYALSLKSPVYAASSAPALIQFTIRRFYPVDALLSAQPAAIRMLADLVLLPLNYFMELGVFLAAALVWRRTRRDTGKPFTPAEFAIALMVVTSVVVCTFLRSSVIANNDLGWRGFLLAQFGLLLLAVDVLSTAPRRGALLILAALGAVGSAYDVGILRFFPVLSDAGITAHLDWISPAQAGLHNRAAHEAYQWLAASTPITAVVQFDPHTYSQDTSAFVFAQRQFAAGDATCLATFGGDASLCPALIRRLDAVFPSAGAALTPDLRFACRSLPVDFLIAKDVDPVWKIPNSWVWTEKPVYANAYFRVFPCRAHP